MWHKVQRRSESTLQRVFCCLFGPFYLKVQFRRRWRRMNSISISTVTNDFCLRPPLQSSGSRALYVFQLVKLSPWCQWNSCETERSVLISLPLSVPPTDSVKQRGGRVFVHCQAGISRSATICLAYLMHTQRVKLDEAFDFVKQRRHVISPNLAFMGQLLQFETDVLCQGWRGRTLTWL